MPKYRFDLDLSAEGYRGSIRDMRRWIDRDRSPVVSDVRVWSAFDSAKGITLSLRHSDIYTLGLDFGKGSYFFSNYAAQYNTRPLEFESNYFAMGLTRSNQMKLSHGSLHNGIAKLAGHETQANGSGMLNDQKAALVRLIFSLSEGLRFKHVEDAVAGTLASLDNGFVINDFEDQLVNRWKTLSEQPDCQKLGVALRHLP